MGEHTPGPWRWEVNPKARSIVLSGNGGLVMDIVRWGMSQASPRFRNGFVMCPAVDFSVPIPGEEHHAEWDRLLSHPDAALIAAAPDLLAALRIEMADKRHRYDPRESGCPACSAIAKYEEVERA